MNTHWGRNRTPHMFTHSLMSPLSDNVRLLFTFSKSATLHSPHLAMLRSLVSHRLILLVRSSIVTMMVLCRLTWGSIPSSTTSTTPGNKNTRLFHSHSANLRKIAWVCCLMTVHMRHSKPRCCASYTHMIKSPQDMLTKNQHTTGSSLGTGIAPLIVSFIHRASSAGSHTTCHIVPTNIKEKLDMDKKPTIVFVSTLETGRGLKKVRNCKQGTTINCSHSSQYTQLASKNVGTCRCNSWTSQQEWSWSFKGDNAWGFQGWKGS